MSAFSRICSRVSCWSLRPIQRAGSRKMGTRIRAEIVTCQESRNIVTSTMVKAMRLPTTPLRVEVNACWAPITSLFSREISAPVCARVKKAID